MIQYKIIVLGDSNVGKTSIIKRYESNIYVDNSKATIAIDFIQKKLDNMILQIWDTAGQERYQSITPSFFRNVDGVVLVYDVNDEASADNIKVWHIDFLIQNNIDNQIFPFIVVGNKYDLKCDLKCDLDNRHNNNRNNNRNNNINKVKKWCDEKIIPHYLTSAKTNHKINNNNNVHDIHDVHDVHDVQDISSIFDTLVNEIIYFRLKTKRKSSASSASTSYVSSSGLSEQIVKKNCSC